MTEATSATTAGSRSQASTTVATSSLPTTRLRRRARTHSVTRSGMANQIAPRGSRTRPTSHSCPTCNSTCAQRIRTPHTLHTLHTHTRTPCSYARPSSCSADSTQAAVVAAAIGAAAQSASVAATALAAAPLAAARVAALATAAAHALRDAPAPVRPAARPAHHPVRVAGRARRARQLPHGVRAVRGALPGQPRQHAAPDHGGAELPRDRRHHHRARRALGSQHGLQQRPARDLWGARGLLQHAGPDARGRAGRAKHRALPDFVKRVARELPRRLHAHRDAAEATHAADDAAAAHAPLRPGPQPRVARAHAAPRAPGAAAAAEPTLLPQHHGGRPLRPAGGRLAQCHRRRLLHREVAVRDRDPREHQDAHLLRVGLHLRGERLGHLRADASLRTSNPRTHTHTHTHTLRGCRIYRAPSPQPGPTPSATRPTSAASRARSARPRSTIRQRTKTTPTLEAPSSWTTGGGSTWTWCSSTSTGSRTTRSRTPTPTSRSRPTTARAWPSTRTTWRRTSCRGDTAAIASARSRRSRRRGRPTRSSGSTSTPTSCT